MQTVTIPAIAVPPQLLPGFSLPEQTIEVVQSPDARTIQERIDDVRYTGGVVTLAAADVGAPVAPVNMRQASYVTLDLAGRMLVTEFPAGNRWPAIDMTGATHCTVRNGRINTLDGTTAACGIWLGRFDATAQAGGNQLEKLAIGAPAPTSHGAWTVAAVASCGDEIGLMTGCELRTNRSTGAAYLSSQWNLGLVESPYGPIVGTRVPVNGGKISNVMPMTMLSCILGTDPGTPVIKLVGCYGLRLVGCCLSAKSPRSHAIELGVADAPTVAAVDISLDGVWEADGCASFVRVLGETRNLHISGRLRLAEGGNVVSVAESAALVGLANETITPE